MNDTYKEILIKRKKSGSASFMKFGLIFLTVFLLLASLFFWPAMVLALILGVVSYIMIPKFDVEYEYLYVNGSLSIDAIYSKQKRKSLAEYEMSELEILAPIKSHALDSFRNDKNLTVRDYTSGEGRPNTYGIIYNKEKGRVMIQVELDEDIIQDMRRLAPRKVNQY